MKGTSPWTEGGLQLLVRHPSKAPAFSQACENRAEDDEEASTLALGSSEPTLRSPELHKDRQTFRVLATPLLTAKLRNKISGYCTTLALYMDLPCKNSQVTGLGLCVGFWLLFFMYSEDNDTTSE